MKNKEVEQQHIEMQKKFSEKGFHIEDFKIVAIGYLDISEPFEKGEVSASFLSKLKLLWDKGSILASCGHHDCEFCIDEGNYKDRATSGSEKILIDRKNKIRYIFPEMIFHYITSHKFKPSDDFIEFVMRS